MSDTQKIIPHLWFDDSAEEAVDFYTSLFANSEVGATTHYGKAGFDVHRQPAGAVMTVEFELDGYRFIALNGGPHFKFNPSISFFVACETEDEVDYLWEALSDGGEPLMPLGSYEWSEKYGWVADRYGVTWQLSHDQLDDGGQKITPSLMFVGEEAVAAEALELYTSIFEDSEIEHILHYEPDEPSPEEMVKYAQFRLSGEGFMAIESPPEYHDFHFNEAISFLIDCEDQREIDHFWTNLSANPEAEQCGWLEDRFGVSWQVSPSELREMLLDADRDKVERVTEAFLKMKKIDLERLREVYES